MAAMANPFGALWSAVKAVWWWLGGIVGDHDYENYVAHLTAHHPDADVPTKREYWRARYDNQENNPASRCC